MCERQETKKYLERGSPPYPANECKGEEKLGNDGRKYVSKADKNGVHKWVALEKKSPKTPSPQRSPKSPKVDEFFSRDRKENCEELIKGETNKTIFTKLVNKIYKRDKDVLMEQMGSAAKAKESIAEMLKHDIKECHETRKKEAPKEVVEQAEAPVKKSYKLLKSDDEDKWWVINAETGRKFSKLPLDLEVAKRQLRAVYASTNAAAKKKALVGGWWVEKFLQNIFTK